METARLQQQREDEAEARRQARAAEKAAEKAGLQRKPLVAPAAAVATKEESTWRRTPRVDGPQPTVPAARSESPAPPVAKYRPNIAGGGWRAKMEAKQAAAAGGGGGGGGSRDAAAAAPAAPAVLAPTAAQASSVPLKEESKMDGDGFQQVPTRSSKEPWRPRRGRA
jgi:translation initiation factor 3 subunit A